MTKLNVARIVMYVSIIFTLCLIFGCERSSQEQHALTQQSAENPKYILTMPDGRNLYRIVVAADFEDHDHYIYFFSTNDVNTVSVNYSVRRGKTSFNQTIVIDGVTYQAVTNN